MLILIVLALTFASKYIAPYGPLEVNTLAIYKPPTLAHVLGTDSLGRDVFSRVVYGAGITISVAAIALAISLGIGSVLGIITGYLGGKLDRLITLPMDALYSLPTLLLALLIAVILGGGIINTGVAVGLGGITAYYRIMRSVAISLREENFVTAEVSMGASSRYIIVNHIFPLCFSAIVVVTTIRLATVILTISSLGFLGLGVPPPTPEWGADIAQGRTVLLSGIWWPSLAPSLFLFLTVLGVNMFGESLNKIFGGTLEEI